MTSQDVKRENFVRLAEARVNKALKSIRMLGNLSNRSHYAYNEDDIAAIISALQAETNALRTRFRSSGAQDNAPFRLSP